MVYLFKYDQVAMKTSNNRCEDIVLFFYALRQPMGNGVAKNNFSVKSLKKIREKKCRGK